MFAITNNKTEAPKKPIKILSLTSVVLFTVSHTNIINIKINVKYFLNVGYIFPER